MAKVEINPVELELIKTVKEVFNNSNVRYTQKYSTKRKNFPDRRNHKFWNVGFDQRNGDFAQLESGLKTEVAKISGDYQVSVQMPKADWDVVSVKLVYLPPKN